MLISKIKKWLLPLVIGSFVMYFFTSFLILRDPYRDEVEKFVKVNPKILTQIGKIKSIKISRVISVRATENDPSYRLYYVNAKGEISTAIVVVRAQKNNGQPSMNYSLELINGKN